MANQYWNNICAIAEKQRAKGMKTYGMGLEENKKDIITRIEYLEEELIDALMYCEWIKAQIVGAENFAPWDERYGGKDGKTE
jgi:hypothetical protein